MGDSGQGHGQCTGRMNGLQGRFGRVCRHSGLNHKTFSPSEWLYRLNYRGP